MLLILSMTSWAGAETLENFEKIEGGFYISDEQIIALANYIQELQDENSRLLAQVDALNHALENERLFIDKLLTEKDKVIRLQDEQIKDLKFLYENTKPSLFDKSYLLLGGAGVAATILLLAKVL